MIISILCTIGLIWLGWTIFLYTAIAIVKRCERRQQHDEER